jgi:tRNA-2-methylthio-N6-dimethylallyladenosine synthase
MNYSSFFIKSYGCQMNIYDSEKIITILEKKGLKQSQDPEDSDLIVFNTCNIRDKAAHKLYSDIGRVNKINREKIIAVVGCVAQAENSEMFKKNKSIDIVLGPQSYHLLPKMIDDFESNPKQINTEFIVNEKFDYLSEQSRPQGISSYLTIQEGCDKFCSFCVVPFTRGPEYSRSINSILKEVDLLTESGAREIVLLGQNVNAYTTEVNGKEVDISYLIEAISENTKVKRIRYTTSHPINMSDNLIKIHSKNNKLMPFLHLPVQSGSSKILKSMNRKYDLNFYRQIIEKLKNANSKIEISSDFIVGYPGESDDDFKQTLDLVDEIKFTQSYSFIYSQRYGTKSALKEDLTPLCVKKERLTILQKKLNEIQLNFNKSFCNKNVNVLIENQSISNPDYFFGRTPFMQSVYVKSQGIKAGEEKNINISTCNHKSLYATC